MKRSTLWTLAAIAAVAALFFYLTAAQATEECTVCMEFRGRSNCATASAPTRDEAEQGARNTACGPIAQGMDETIACGNTPSATVRCRSR